VNLGEIELRLAELNRQENETWQQKAALLIQARNLKENWGTKKNAYAKYFAWAMEHSNWSKNRIWDAIQAYQLLKKTPKKFKDFSINQILHYHRRYSPPAQRGQRDALGEIKQINLAPSKPEWLSPKYDVPKNDKEFWFADLFNKANSFKKYLPTIDSQSIRECDPKEAKTIANFLRDISQKTSEMAQELDPVGALSVVQGGRK